MCSSRLFGIPCLNVRKSYEFPEHTVNMPMIRKNALWEFGQVGRTTFDYPGEAMSETGRVYYYLHVFAERDMNATGILEGCSKEDPPSVSTV